VAEHLFLLLEADPAALADIYALTVIARLISAQSPLNLSL